MEPCLLYAGSERGIYRLQNEKDITEERVEIPEAFALNTAKLPEKVFLLRKKLYLKAKKEPKFRFYALYDRIYRRDVLAAAWAQVKRNGGTGGVDGVQIEDICETPEKEHGFLDEIQRVPELLSYIQTEVDSDDTAGRFILTGSQQFLLMQKVGQTLAGRVALLQLLPFSLSELIGAPPIDPFRIDEMNKVGKQPAFSLEQILHQGLYPRIYDKNLPAHKWLGDYYRMYVERDVRDVLKIGNLDTFQRFDRLCAGRCSQLLNLSSLANDCGITHPTAKQWISVLQASFIVTLISPHHANFSK